MFFTSYLHVFTTLSFHKNLLFQSLVIMDSICFPLIGLPPIILSCDQWNTSFCNLSSFIRSISTSYFPSFLVSLNIFLCIIYRCIQCTYVCMGLYIILYKWTHHKGLIVVWALKSPDVLPNFQNFHDQKLCFEQKWGT
jgi:hypothetical protein